MAFSVISVPNPTSVAPPPSTNRVSLSDAKDSRTQSNLNKLEYTIKWLQERIHNHVKSVGGYWRPLSGLARLTEEIAELAEVLEEKEIDIDRLSSELADVFMISTCLANQYCADLSREYNKLSVPIELAEITSPFPSSEGSDSFLRIVSITGKLARLINSYEGDKKPKKGEELSSVQEVVANLHKEIWSFSKQKGIDLLSHLEKVLEKSRKRDKDRFAHLYDPVMTSSLQSFQVIKTSTHCPFAASAKIWANPEWKKEKKMEENISDAIPHILRFIRVAVSEGLDGFVITAPGCYGTSLKELAKFTRLTLKYLSDQDPANIHCMDKGVDGNEWQFSFNGQRFFVITFAPCYPATHSRYAFGMDATFIFLQPEHSFSKSKVPRGESPGKLRDSIRKSFSDNNQPYFSNIITTELEAPRYVKPVNLHDKPVKWWDGKQEEGSTAKKYSCFGFLGKHTKTVITIAVAAAGIGAIIGSKYLSIR